MVQSGNTWNSAVVYAPQVTSNGFGFSYDQQIDVPYRIQISTNLIDWVNISSGQGSGRPTNFVYAVSSNYPAQFVRIVSP
jgi:hypothetical protein